jgi:hypothetical protein
VIITDENNNILDTMKKQNPNANWGNLFMGLAILVMVAVFSYAYFSRPKDGSVSIDMDKVLQEVQKEGSDKNTTGRLTNNGQENGSTDGTEEGIPAEPGEKGAAPTGMTTTVQKGEGLWQVAQRVCGDGEKYSKLAVANGLNVWDELEVGMTLKVVCN